MHLWIRHPFLWIFLLVWISFTVPAATPETKAGKVDLSKTLALFQSWAARDRFPESVSFAYYNAYARQVLQGEIPSDIRSRVFSFVKRCQRADGGFASNRKYPGKSNITYSFYALKALQIVDALDNIDQAKAVAFIQSLIRDDGSIAPSPSEMDRPTLSSTYYGVAALHILGKTDLLDGDKTIAFVLSHRNKDGGFGINPKGSSNPQGTSMAVQTLAVLNGLNKETVNATVTYLEQAIALLGVSGKRQQAFSTMQASTNILLALVAMQALKEVETAPIQEYVESLYIPVNGGFGPYTGYGTTPPSTFQGVYCLKTLGNPSMPVVLPKAPGNEAEEGETGSAQSKP